MVSVFLLGMGGGWRVGLLGVVVWTVAGAASVTATRLIPDARQEILIGPGLVLSAATMTLLADAMFWDFVLSMFALLLWIVASLGWGASVLLNVSARRWRRAAVHAVTLPLALAAGLTLVVSSDLPARAALAVSVPELNALLAADPDHATDEWAGVFHITERTTDATGTRFAVAPLPGLSDRPLLSTGCFLVHANPAEHRLLTDHTTDHGPPTVTHLSGDWYTACYPSADTSYLYPEEG
ncbi:hypothetical protein GCM10027589_21210 [Actinocorallia lasiicapitis]